MNVLDFVKSIMIIKFIIVSIGDKLIVVKEIFDNNCIYYVFVVCYKELVGIISKIDFMYFLCGFNCNQEDCFVNEVCMWAYNVEDIMMKGIVKFLLNDCINVVLEVFLENCFYVVLVVSENGEFEGILIIFDIIKVVVVIKVMVQEILESKK